VKASATSAFRALNTYNYRLWAGGALVSNIGAWMQRIAQDWLVLTVLTHKNAAAVGLVVGLQFGPQLLLLPLTGWAADRLDRRKLIFATQAAMGALAFGLGVLTLGEWVQLWQVYLFAFLLGCVAAFDAPARQTFVCELVGEAGLANAVGLNSASFNAARMIGPAIAGVLIAAVGSGWAFMINAATFVAVLAALMRMRVGELHVGRRAGPGHGGLAEGFSYVWRRPDLRVILVMLFLIGTFGLNFAIYISTMAVAVFHVGAGRYGLLTSTMAIGSVSGALMAARRAKPKMTVLALAAALFGVGCAAAAAAPSPWIFALTLIVIGASVQTFTTSSTSLVQLSTDPAMRGRVMAIVLAVTLGGAPLGGPVAGWIADRFGPRWALMVGAASGLAAAAAGLRYLVRRPGAPALSSSAPSSPGPSSPASLAPASSPTLDAAIGGAYSSGASSTSGRRG
jgi:MFS family permease